jgi:hypothetical protein
MATAIETQDLRPGDLVDIKYEIRTDNRVQLGLAVHSIKQALASDERFNYQGSREVTASELATGAQVRWLIVTVEVRKTLRQEQMETKTQEAGFWIPLVAIVALMTTAVFAWGHAVKYVSATKRELGYPPAEVGALGWGAIAAVALVVLFILSRG